MSAREDIRQLVDWLLKKALEKTNDNLCDAEDLVQETLLAYHKALLKGTEIENLTGYLMKILDSKFIDSIRDQKLVEEFHDVTVEQEVEFDDDEISDEVVRQMIEYQLMLRELTFLSETYRYVVVQHYIHKKKVKEIAQELNLSVEAVKQRLYLGRHKMMEGVMNTENPYKTSYEPKYLTIRFSGRAGKNGEPEKIITNLVDQNVLILAYNEPMTSVDISRKLNISTAYVEESVERLLKHEFLRKRKNKVLTDFLIINEEMLRIRQDVSMRLVEDTFHRVKGYFGDLVEEYIKLGALHAYSREQLFIYAILSVGFYIRQSVLESQDLFRFDDYPDRADGGKWIIDAGYVTKTKNAIHDFLYSHGPCKSVFYKRLIVEEWDTSFGNTFRSDYSMDISNEERYQLLIDIQRGNDFDPKYLPLIPDLLRLGFIKVSDKSGRKWDVCIPIITEKDYDNVTSLNALYSQKVMDEVGEDILTTILANPLSYPKWLNPKNPYSILGYISILPLCAVKKASNLGTIKLEDTKSYPVCMIVEKQ